MKPTLYNMPMESFSVESLEGRTLLASIEVAACENINGYNELRTFELKIECLKHLEDTIYQEITRQLAALDSIKANLVELEEAQLEKLIEEKFIKLEANYLQEIVLKRSEPSKAPDTAIALSEQSIGPPDGPQQVEDSSMIMSISSSFFDG